MPKTNRSDVRQHVVRKAERDGHVQNAETNQRCLTPALGDLPDQSPHVNAQIAFPLVRVVLHTVVVEIGIR